MKIYALYSGLYEDRRVVGLFTSIEKLDEFKNKYSSQEGYDEEHEIFETDYFPDVTSDKKIYFVNRKVTFDKEEYTAFTSDIAEMRNINKMFDDIFGNYVTTHVWASSEGEAINTAKKLFKEADKNKKRKVETSILF